jgi:hypothetical protein
MNYPAAELRGIKMNLKLIYPDAEHRGILLIKTHFEEYPENGAIASVLYIITYYYLCFAMLFMQRWGQHGLPG